MSTAGMGRAVSTDRAKAIEAWFTSLDRVRTRLATLPGPVRDEVLIEIRARAIAAATMGRDRIEWAADDVAICRARVVSRLRLKRHGPRPADGQTYLEQVRAIEAELDRIEAGA